MKDTEYVSTIWVLQPPWFKSWVFTDASLEPPTHWPPCALHIIALCYQTYCCMIESILVCSSSFEMPFDCPLHGMQTRALDWKIAKLPFTLTKVALIIYNLFLDYISSELIYKRQRIKFLSADRISCSESTGSCRESSLHPEFNFIIKGTQE